MPDNQTLPEIGTLERRLAAGQFAVTAEIVPPRVPALTAVTKKALALAPVADAVNITDNASANVKMSSIAVSLYLAQMGIEPVFQVVCRDRNRLAMQADLLGVLAMGVQNIFAITGDHIIHGDHPQAKPVHDVDSVQLIQIFNRIRTEGLFASGVEVRATPKFPIRTPHFFLGGAANPFGDPLPIHVLKMAKKKKAGADFIQTQCIFDMDRFREFMSVVRDNGLDEKLHILAGVMPVKSNRALEFMADSVPGMRIPPKSITRLGGADDIEEEGIKMTVEIIEELKEVPGVRGVHVMTVGWEAIIPELLSRTNLLPENRGDLPEIETADDEPAAA
jgi:methylenetetrahydrofolate reductase (NADPH)